MNESSFTPSLKLAVYCRLLEHWCLNYLVAMTRSMFGGAKEKLLNIKHCTNCRAWWWGDHGVRLVNCTEQIEKWRRRTTAKLSNFTLNQQLDGWNLNKDGRFNRTMCDPRYTIKLVSERVTFSFWLTVSGMSFPKPQPHLD